MKILTHSEGRLELHGVHVGTVIQGPTEMIVSVRFPAHTSWAKTKSLEEAECFVLAQLSWFVRWTGIVNQPLGDGEPVAVVEHYGQRDGRSIFKVLTGQYRAHDNAVDVDQGYQRVLVERNQELLLRSPLDHTGIDEQLKFDRKDVCYEA